MSCSLAGQICQPSTLFKAAGIVVGLLCRVLGVRDSSSYRIAAIGIGQKGLHFFERSDVELRD